MNELLNMSTKDALRGTIGEGNEIIVLGLVLVGASVVGLTVGKLVKKANRVYKSFSECKKEVES